MSVDIKYGYGAGFETEIIDLSYENFETEKLKILKTKIFGNQKIIVQSLKLNYLNLEDLGRNKFDFSKNQIFIFKKKYEYKYLLSEKKLSNQVEVVMKTEW